MKDGIKEYHQFLADNFPGLKLNKPLFYNWGKALRFDLERNFDNDSNSVLYFDEVIKRAVTLYEASFKPNDNAFFILRQYKFKKGKIRTGNYFFKQLTGLNKVDVSYCSIKSFNYSKDTFNIAIGETLVKQINISNILSAIALSNMPRIKSFEKFYNIDLPFEIYFINKDKKLIFHMYDNRGLDILGDNVEAIRPMYTTYNNWILDYDRKQMNSLFE
ncbi:DUF3885 domain-containing protein [Mucilaginibacter aquariorum]|uniref:DUF3885 domain-containing protein n=1 Tax=Mucilaginibacter aquariorum TaxID=2967225 RepID=A0ABT1T3K4_9SPHI|nr:DUF3885 domain-containing protein [Mucilaginibacter aquariorum]MCQ6959000.1 DUF3885 domain-containing protein [Mucilaginibacter aquariorum]